MKEATLEPTARELLFARATRLLPIAEAGAALNEVRCTLYLTPEDGEKACRDACDALETAIGDWLLGKKRFG
jgi:hypothetical protein